MNTCNILGFQIDYFKGIYTCQYKWVKDEGLVVVGDHGDGKSNVIEALNVLLEGAPALKKIDNPVQDGAKKYTIVADFENKGNALACYDVGETFRITATQSVSGKQQLKIENLKDGAPVKGTVRDILKTLRGLYVDPHQLMKDLEEYNGDRKLADRVLKNIGLDLSEFDEKEENLAAQWSAEDQEVQRFRKVIETIEVPVEGFPKVKIDTDKLWQESAAYKEFSDRSQNKENNQKLLQVELQNAAENHGRATEDCKKSQALIDEIKLQIEGGTQSIKIVKDKGLSDLESMLRREIPFSILLGDLGEKVSQLKEEYGNAGLSRERSKESLKLEELKLGELNKNREDLAEKVKEVKSKIESSEKPEIWDGLKDDNENEDERLSPDKFITKSIQDAQISNTSFAKKEEHDTAQKNLKTSEQSRDNTNKLRKENSDARTKAVAESNFGVDGLSVNENGVLTAKVDGKPIVTLKDLNHADKLRVLSEILMVNNDKPLKLIVIQEGYACRPEYQKIIFDQARKHGYTAIMESFVPVDDEGCLWMQDGKSFDVQPADAKVFEADHNIEEKVEGAPDWM